MQSEGSSYKVTIFKNSEKPTGLHPLLSGIGNERVNTGCDTTSAFRGRGKKSAWQAWQAYEEVTQTFTFLAAHPFELLHAESDQ